MAPLHTMIWMRQKMGSHLAEGEKLNFCSRCREEVEWICDFNKQLRQLWTPAGGPAGPFHQNKDRSDELRRKTERLSILVIVLVA